MRMIRLDWRLATAALAALVVVLASTTLYTRPALAAASGVEAIHVHTALPEADATHSVIVKLIGDGEMQVTSPDDDSRNPRLPCVCHIFQPSDDRHRTVRRAGDLSVYGRLPR